MKLKRLLRCFSTKTNKQIARSKTGPTIVGPVFFLELWRRGESNSRAGVSVTSRKVSNRRQCLAIPPNNQCVNEFVPRLDTSRIATIQPQIRREIISQQSSAPLAQKIQKYRSATECLWSPQLPAGRSVASPTVCRVWHRPGVSRDDRLRFFSTAGPVGPINAG
jgi:hypothetical protein